MSGYDFFAKFFWVLIICGNGINSLIYYFRMRRGGESEEALVLGKKLCLGYWFLSSIPFFFMGAGLLFGQAETIFDFLQSQEHVTTVSFFYASIPFVFFLYVLWVFLYDGAEKLAPYSQYFWKNSKKSSSPKSIKVVSIVMLLGSCAWTAIFWFMFTKEFTHVAL